MVVAAQGQPQYPPPLLKRSWVLLHPFSLPPGGFAQQHPPKHTDRHPEKRTVRLLRAHTMLHVVSRRGMRTFPRIYKESEVCQHLLNKHVDFLMRCTRVEEIAYEKRVSPLPTTHEPIPPAAPGATVASPQPANRLNGLCHPRELCPPRSWSARTLWPARRTSGPSCCSTTMTSRRAWTTPRPCVSLAWRCGCRRGPGTTC